MVANSPSYCMKVAKSTLKIKEFKRFQVDCISVISQRTDVIVVQATASGKSLCLHYQRYFILVKYH